jgi:hypothetical protein
VELIVDRAECRYWWDGLERLADFRPAPASPYNCLVCDALGTWDPTERDALARALLDSGCRYVVCGGETCERWHDDVEELLAERAAARGDDGPFVGTTWHTGEAPGDVAEFFVMHAKGPAAEPAEHLVLQLGLDWDLQNDLMVWVRGWVEHPYGIDASESAG